MGYVFRVIARYRRDQACRRCEQGSDPSEVDNVGRVYVAYSPRNDGYYEQPPHRFLHHWT
ncbi:hypothetical protein BVI1335_1220043 [Burkholderia vietnamiensis]|nr:hypothetical protein BVI1335_1220043 [Burkholderia vietnamiensis]